MAFLFPFLVLKKSSGALNHLFQSITFELKISGRFVKEKPRSLSLNRIASIFLTMKKLLCLLENNASINVKPERGGGGETRVYVGHLTFRENFGQNPHRGAPKFWSNQIKYPHLVNG